MLAKHLTRPITVAISATLLAGCAAMTQQNQLEEFNQYVAAGDFNSAAEFSLDLAEYNPKHKQVDDLFWTLQSAASLNKLDQYALSTELLDAAETRMRANDTESLLAESGETTAALMVNDAVMDYQTTHYDGVMVNTLKAWNFMAQGDMNNARVEFNRAYERERRAVQHFKAEIIEQKKELSNSGAIAGYVNQTVNSKNMQYALKDAGIALNRWQPYQGYTNPFVTYSQSLFYLLNGTSRSDFNRAIDGLTRVYSMTGSKAVASDLALAKQLRQNPSRKINNQVWVIFENGQSMIREEKRLDLPLFLLQSDIAYVGAALPRLQKRDTAYPNIKVSGQPTELVSDMDKVIAAEFDKDFPIILTREVIRLLIKGAGQKLLAQESEWLEGAGAIYSVATTGADVRSFSALPAQYQATRVNKKGDSVALKIGQETLSVPLDKNFTRHIVWVSVPTADATPTVSVINL